MSCFAAFSFSIGNSGLGECEGHALSPSDARVIVGVSDATWDPRIPQRAWQLFTGVRRQWRRGGLAKCLKAALLRQVRASHPSVTEMITSNASENTAMLAVNARIGFAVFRTHGIYRSRVTCSGRGSARGFRADDLAGREAVRRPTPRPRWPSPRQGRPRLSPVCSRFTLDVDQSRQRIHPRLNSATRTSWPCAVSSSRGGARCAPPDFSPPCAERWRASLRP